MHQYTANTGTHGLDFEDNFEMSNGDAVRIATGGL